MNSELSIDLPECLTQDAFGCIMLRGHRISLEQLMTRYEEGMSAEGLQENFPTLDFALIHSVLAFYWSNRLAVDAYLTSSRREMQKQHESSRKVDWNQLRDRMATRAAG